MVKSVLTLAASLTVGVFAGVTGATAQGVADHVPEAVRGQQFELSIRDTLCEGAVELQGPVWFEGMLEPRARVPLRIH
jgi:hypothetical protein